MGCDQKRDNPCWKKIGRGQVASEGFSVACYEDINTLTVLQLLLFPIDKIIEKVDMESIRF